MWTPRSSTSGRSPTTHWCPTATTSKLRMVAPGSVTAGRYGLVEYHVAPHSPGAPPHFHQTFSESFYVLIGRADRLPRGVLGPVRPG